MESIKLNRHDTIILIRSLVAQQSKTYSLTELLNDFKTEVGYPLPTFGHKTALEFLRSIPETVKVISESRNFYIKPAPGQESSYIGSTIMKSGLLPDSKSKVPSTSRKPNQPRPWNKDEPRKVRIMKQYNRKKNEKKDTSKNDTLTAPSTSEPDEKEKMLEEYWIKRHAALCYRCISREGKFETEPVIDRCLSSITLKQSDISYINVIYYTEVGDDIEVSVTEVHNPHKFFLHLKKFRNDLTRLMSSLQIFYSVYNAKYAAIKYRFKAGQICAALCKITPEHSEWYRAKVVKYGDEMSTVFLIDYGTTMETSSSNLKFLDRNFGQLPMQALNGRLGNIKPRDGKFWSEECCKKFYSLVFEQEVVARVAKIESEKHCLNVFLSCGERGDLRVDNALIEGRLAVAVGGSGNKELLSSVVYESKNRQGMLRPEDIGKNRKPRIKPIDSD